MTVIYVLLITHFIGDFICQSNSAKYLPAALAPRFSGTPVGALLGSGSPSDVTGFVVPGIVDSVKGVTWRWTLSNVIEKRTEVAAPSRADRDATATVVGVLRHLRIQTT